MPLSDMEGSEIIEDSEGAYAVLAHADGGASVVLASTATEEEATRAFPLVAPGRVLTDNAQGVGEAEGDHYVFYSSA